MITPLADGILFTDFYQLTMAQVYFRMGLHERPARFEHYFRNNPNYGAHQAGYCVMAGIAPLVEWMQTVCFTDTEIEILRSQTDGAGQSVFQDDFLEWLRENGDFSRITLEAIPEGRVVHPNIPLTVITGPLAMAQILETVLLNQINFATLIATKASRIRESVGDSAMVLEFGLRRAQGYSANTATRSALIGGANFSSNVGKSIEMGLSPKGTHAHAMIQAAVAMGMSELDAFRHYADLYPNNALFLVDTIDTLNSGVPNAITVFKELKAKGFTPVGIRLDSGDLAYLAIQSAKQLDAAGFPDVSIVLSNDLDELVIWQILKQIQEEATQRGMDAANVIQRLVYGVGTRLVTSEGDSALGGVYKLVALQDDEGKWQPAIKVSEVAAKTPIPGVKRVYRIYDANGMATADYLTLADESLEHEMLELRHPMDVQRRRVRRDAVTIEELLVPFVVNGQRVETPATLAEMRSRRHADVTRLDPGVRRLINPHIYHVSLSPTLWTLKYELIERARHSSR